MNASRWFLVLLAASPLAGQQPDSVRTFTLPGVVLDYSTEQPVAGATVEIEALDRRVFTDSLGRFAFQAIAEGQHTFVTGRIGYVDVEEVSEVREGNLLIVRLWPKPIVLEGITAIADQFETRRKSVGVASSASGRRRLLVSTAPTVADFLQDHHHVGPPVLCPSANDRVNETECLFIRGRRVRVIVYIDEMPMAGGIALLEAYRPDDLYRVEVYPSLRQIRIFTPHYVEMLARQGRRLQPICLVCRR